MRYMTKALILFLAVSVSLSLAQTADIPSQIDRAKALYSQGKYSEAVTELNVAISQIQSLQMDNYKTVFPAALAGWQAEEFEGNTAGMAFMGGGISVSRDYKMGEETSVSIEMVSDSPMLSSLMMMFSNPMFLGDKKIVPVGSERAIEEWNETDKTGNLQIVVDNRVIFTVNGNNITGKDVLYSYASKINFAKLRSLLK